MPLKLNYFSSFPVILASFFVSQFSNNLSFSDYFSLPEVAKTFLSVFVLFQFAPTLVKKFNMYFFTFSYPDWIRKT